MENKQNNNNGPRMPKFNMNWIYAFVLIALAVAFFTGHGGMTNTSASITKDYTTFKDYVNKGYALRVVVNKKSSNLRMYVRPEHIRDVFKAGVKQVGTEPYAKVEIGSVDNLEAFLNQAMQQKKIASYSYENKDDNGFVDILISFLPWVLFIIVWVFIMNRMSGGGGPGGVFNVGKSKARLYEKANDLGITFKDVAGQALVGPPGTGKTQLAKAVAGEAGVPFFSMSGSDFVEMFVGVGASRVRDVFQQAKSKSPCIIFIDEIDAVGRARSKNPAMGGNDERENTLNALLTEMDGFGTNSGVIVLAALRPPDTR